VQDTDLTTSYQTCDSTETAPTLSFAIVLLLFFGISFVDSDADNSGGFRKGACVIIAYLIIVVGGGGDFIES